MVLAASAGKDLKFAIEEFNRACNTLSELAFQRDLHRKYDIHHQGYRLNSNLRPPGLNTDSPYARIGPSSPPFRYLLQGFTGGINKTRKPHARSGAEELNRACRL